MTPKIIGTDFIRLLGLDSAKEKGSSHITYNLHIRTSCTAHVCVRPSMLVCVKVDAAESDAPVGVHHRYADVKLICGESVK